MTYADNGSVGAIMITPEGKVECIRGNIEPGVWTHDVEGRPVAMFAPAAVGVAMAQCRSDRPAELFFRNAYTSLIRATMWRRPDGGWIGHWRRIDPAWARLTQREQEVARAVAQTGDLQAAASEIAMRYNTLMTHRKSIAAKARLDSIGDFVSWCRQNAVSIPLML